MNTGLKNKLTFGSYDFSNSGYVIIFQSFLFPFFFVSVENVQEGSSSIWPWVVTATSIIAIIGAPYIGKAGDVFGKWKIFATLVAVAGIGAALIPAVSSENLWILIIGFIIFNAAFEYSQSIYNSFLLNFEGVKEKITELSSFGWGFGYLGGALFAAIFIVLDKFNWPEHLTLMTFGSLFLLLSIPAIRGFRKSESKTATDHTQLREVNWRKFFSLATPVPWSHILIYWIIADAVVGVVYFTPLFLTQEVGLSLTAIGGVILVAQIIAFPATIFMGRMANRFGRIKTIQFSLLLWVVGLVGFYLSTSIVHVVIAMTPLIFVLGSTQAILRAHFASRVTQDASGEGLGFYAIAQKSASVVSPALVGLTVFLTGSLRPAFLVIALIIVIGFLLAPKLNSQIQKHRPNEG